MRYSTFLVALIAALFFSNCSKKDLPAPNPLNASNTNITQKNIVVPPLTAPCASSLVRNKISYGNSSGGTSDMLCIPSASRNNNIIEIACSDYRLYFAYDLIKIYLPDQGTFTGKMKYDVKEVSSPSASVALLSHVYYSPNYSSPVYTGYEGSIYAEYTSSEIILSFCGVKVHNGASIHYVTGQAVIGK